MIIKWSTPCGFVVFCDDIRDEVGGLRTYVGCYAEDMILTQPLPTFLARMGFSIRYLERPGESLQPVKVVVTVPGELLDKEETIFEAIIFEDGVRPPHVPSVADDNEDIFLVAQFQVRVSPLVIHREGRIRVKAYRGDDEIRLGSLRIISRPSADAGLVPS